jgi:hypothetical protein
MENHPAAYTPSGVLGDLKQAVVRCSGDISPRVCNPYGQNTTNSTGDMEIDSSQIHRSCSYYLGGETHLRVAGQ